MFFTYLVLIINNLTVLRSFVMQVLESLASILVEGSGRGLCRKIVSVVKAANVLGLTFSEAFEKQPLELLQLLSLKAQESFEEAKLLVQTHSMPASNIAQILAESFLKVHMIHIFEYASTITSFLNGILFEN